MSCAAICSQASPTSPHCVTRNGIVLGVVSDTSGLQPRDIATGQASGKRQYRPFICTFSPDSSTPLLRDIGFEFTHPPLAKDAVWTIHRCDPVFGGGLDFSVQSPGLSSMTMPTLVTNSQSSSKMSMSLDCDDVSLIGLLKPSTTESDLIGKQKAWLCSNFRCSIDGISDGSSSTGSGGAGSLRIEPFTVTVGPVDILGHQHLLVSDIQMSVSIISSPEYFTWLLNVRNGIDDERTMQLSLSHNDGTPMLSLSMQVQIVSVGPVDIFSPSGSPSYVAVLKYSDKASPLLFKAF